jgi:hypothetical protein
MENLKIKHGWEDAGRTGQRIGHDVLVNGILWTPILWDDEEDPDWHKAQSLAVAK